MAYQVTYAGTDSYTVTNAELSGVLADMEKSDEEVTIIQLDWEVMIRKEIVGYLIVVNSAPAYWSGDEWVGGHHAQSGGLFKTPAEAEQRVAEKGWVLVTEFTRFSEAEHRERFPLIWLRKEISK